MSVRGKEHERSIFIFRRDLRLHDNLGVLRALRESRKVLPVFILDPVQLNGRERYPSVAFMAESLQSLDRELGARGSSLHIMYDSPERAVAGLLKRYLASAVYVSRDSTPYARKRDAALARLCKRQNVAFNEVDSELLYPLYTIRRGDGGIYSIYTPFMRAAARVDVPRPLRNTLRNYDTIVLRNRDSVHRFLARLAQSSLPNPANHGGRKAALRRLIAMVRTQRDYDKRRNMLNHETSMLSPHLRFGCVSPREVWWVIRDRTPKAHVLLNQLLWRDFYYNTAALHQTAYVYSMNPSMRNIKWNSSRTAFDKWATGCTGFPIVDAAMQQMLQTGYMHNRARLISASFLVKVLNVNWVLGDKWFAEHLIDYDRTLNTMNWQWVAGTGTDSQPWFRSFNPWIQSRKYDPSAVYIHRWIPALRSVPAAVLHRWDRDHGAHRGTGYPAPMCNYSTAVKATIDGFRRAIQAHSVSAGRKRG